MLSIPARRAASRSQTASPTTYVVAGAAPSRSAHARKRSGSGFARSTSPRSTTTTSSPTPSAASDASISGRRPDVAMPWVTRRRRSSDRSSTAPGNGRRSGRSSRKISPCRRWMASVSSIVSSRPTSRATARANKPPPIPMRRWMRQPSMGRSASASARCHANTWAYTVSISVPSRSKMRARATPASLPRGLQRQLEAAVAMHRDGEEQVVQCSAVVLVERFEELVLDLVDELSGAGGSHGHDLTAPVVRIAAALDEPVLLQRVEVRDELARVVRERLRDRRLRRPGALVQEGEDRVLVGAEACLLEGLHRLHLQGHAQPREEEARALHELGRKAVGRNLRVHCGISVAQDRLLCISWSQPTIWGDSK